jgi:prolyl 3-hydroxylase /prolyl 3,4-dihydroxylase
LRLYPTNPAEDNPEIQIPTPDWSVVIPPASNQIACFVVQPGRSFHDVEEVFVDGKARMAVSGWYHIPEKGEEGYIEGRKEKLAEKSSMKLLEKNLQLHDQPKSAPTPYPQDEGVELSELDIDMLKLYINPTYLEEKSLSSMASRFSDTKNIQLLKILEEGFAEKLKMQIGRLDAAELPYDGATIPVDTPSWKVSGPPYKQRFLYIKPNLEATKDGMAGSDMSPLDQLAHVLLPSVAFRKLLYKITGRKAVNRDIISRRFRPGLDYTLGLGQEDETPRLDVVFSLTPTEGGWDVPLESEDAMEVDGEGDEDGDEEEPDEKDEKDEKDEEEDDDDDEKDNGEGPATFGENGELPDAADDEIIIVEDPSSDEDEDEDDVEEGDEEGAILDNWGGYEIYMSTGDGKPKHPQIGDAKAKQQQAISSKKQLDDEYDPAVVSTAANDADDGLMLHLPATWNCMNLIYRDKGLMRFTKYVSRAAVGSRWDVGGTFEVE